jgi:hypothetical protein
LLTWEQDAFAYADAYDEDAKRYRGLRYGQAVPISDGSTGLLVKPEAASRQIDAETKRHEPQTGGTTGGATPGDTDPIVVDPSPKPKPTPKPRRFHGTVTLDPSRVGGDAGRVGEEIISHLAGLLGAKVSVTLEIEAEVPDGVNDNVVRIVTENSRTLKFLNHGFETE